MPQAIRTTWDAVVMAMWTAQDTMVGIKYAPTGTLTNEGNLIDVADEVKS
jgi:hypothetical protein